MRIAVIGAGGVGGYFGARLAQAGHDVAFVARGAHLAAIRERGLAIESARGNATITGATATDDAATLAPCDVIMFCVKLWDVESAARQIAPLVAKGGVAIPFQNGLASPEILTRALGAARVVGGVAYIAATVRAPGVIAHTGTMARLRVGAFPGGPADRAAAFVAACAKAGIETELSEDIERALWEKFCFLSAFSGCTCLIRQPIGAVRGDPDVRNTFAAAMREGWTVGRARGVALADDYVAKQLAAADSLPADMKSSMLNDLLAGNRLEAPWLSGAVARMAAEAGLPAPVSATLFSAVKPYVDGALR
jgi:2-dehydropantoate 2-reductase